MTGVITFLIGVFVGGCFGFLLAAVLIAGEDD